MFSCASSSSSMVPLRCLQNARYAKLSGNIGKVKIVVQQAIDVTSRHLCSFARFEVIINKIVCCKKIIQKLWNTFSRVNSNTQYIGVTSTRVSCKPSFAEVWTNVGYENVVLFVSGNCSIGRNSR